MSIPKPIGSQQPHTSKEHLEEEAALAGVAAAEALRGVELAAVVVLGLLVCPPLAILAFVVLAPLFLVAVVLGLLVAVITAPYLLVHHFRGHERIHLPLLAQRLRHAGRALAALAPHRIVADARRLHAGR